MKVWTVTGRTESGDDWEMVFSAAPTSADIEAQIMADPWLREEWEAMCIQGWRVTGMEVIDNGVH